MNKTIIGNIVAAFLPIAGYGAASQGSYSSYQSRNKAVTSSIFSTTKSTAYIASDIAEIQVDENDIHIVQQQITKELVIIDSAVPDKHLFYLQVKPGVDVLELDGSLDGLLQLKRILADYEALDALHIISHATDGVMQLGNQFVDEEVLKQDKRLFSKLNSALKPGADLLLYGCDLAKGEDGDEFLTLIQNNTHLDIAASNDITGNLSNDGDWDLEIKKGDIEAEQPFSELALKDFSDVLQITTGGGTVSNAGAYNGSASIDASYNTGGQVFVFDGADVSTQLAGGYLNLGAAAGPTYETALSISTANGSTFDISSFYFAGDPNVNFNLTSSAGGAPVALNSGTGFETVSFPSLNDITSLTLTFTSDGNNPGRTGFIGSLNQLNISNVTAPDTTDPTFNAAGSSPADNATSVALGSNLQMVFSENIAFGTGNITLRNVTTNTTVETFNAGASGAGSGGGTASISSGTLTINPGSNLSAGFVYSVQIAGTAIDDIAGNSFAGINEDITYNFASQPNAVLSVNPSSIDEDGGIATYTFALQSGSGGAFTAVENVTATFSFSGTATITTDYTVSGLGGSNDLTITTGNSSSTFTVTGVDDSPTVDNNETIIVDLNAISTSNAVEAIAQTATATLIEFVADTDGNLVAGASAEAVTIATTVDTVGEAIDVLDFTISDGGTADGAALVATAITVNVSGTTNDTIRSNVTWRLNGPDAGNVSGVYNIGSDTITFTGLTLSIADGASETYSINAFFNDNTGLTEDQTFILSIDGDTDVTLGSGSTQFGTTSAVTNGAGLAIDVDATQLAFTTQPTGSVSGIALTTQPVVTAQDAVGNTDADFTEILTLSEASAGSLTNGSVSAVGGVATFSNLTYTATADQQSFTLTANDSDGVGSDLPTINANAVTSDVVATQLVYTTQPAPLSVESNVALDLTTDPVVQAQDADGLLDTGFSGAVTLAEVNGAGTATMSATGDTDGSSATVTLFPLSGEVNFNNLNLTYTAAGIGGDETFNLNASAGGVASVNSSQITAGVFDSDGTVVASATISEPIEIPTTAVGSANSVAVFDFTITDGGTSDTRDFIVDAITIDTSTSTLDASALLYSLTGPDGTLVGNFNAGSGVVTFNTQTITVADGTSETYTLNVAFSANPSVTEGQVLVLSTDVNDYTLGTGSTNAANAVAVTNGAGSEVSVAATRLVFTTNPDGVVSGTAFTTQPVVTAQDAAGNTDTDFAETITLSEASAGSITNNTAVAASGVATFSGLTYIATEDNQAFTLTAQDTATNGQLTDGAAALTADVVATQLVARELTEPSIGPITVNNTQNPANNAFTALTVADFPDLGIFGVDVNNVRDDDYNAQVTIRQGVVNGVTTALSINGDLDVNSATVTIATSSSGSSTEAFFPDITASYTASNATEAVNIEVTDNDPNTSDLVVLTANINIIPNVVESPSSFGPFTITEDTRTAIATNDVEVQDADGDDVTLFFGVDRGNLIALDGDGIQGGVTIADSNGSSGSQRITLTGSIANLNTFLDGTRFEYQPDLNDTVAATLTIGASESNVNPGEGTSLSEAITITAVNDVPTISGTPTTSLNQDVAFSFTPTANDVDGDSLTFSVSGNPAWASINTTTGALTGTPGANDVGTTNNIVISVNDGLLSASLPAFSITVNSTNVAPAISGTPATSVNEGALFSFTPTASDVDNNPLTFSIQNAPSWASFSAVSGQLSGTPTASDIGVTSGIVISVSDGLASASLPAFSITVVNVNDAPVISGIPPTSVLQGEVFNFAPTASDADNDTLTFTIQNAPSWANFNSATGQLTGTPGANDIGTTSGIVISVSDGALSASLSAFSIEVVSTNDGPLISGNPDTRVNEDETYNFIPTASDPDGDDLTFSIQNVPSWASFNIATGQLSGTPGNDDVGITQGVVINVTDGNETASLAPFNIDVLPVNDAPIAQNTEATVEEDGSVTIPSIISDVDSQDLSVQVVEGPQNGTVNLSGNDFFYEPDDNFAGSDSFSYVANDGELSSAPAVVTITVTQQNDEPLAQDDSFSFAQDVSGIYTLDVLANDIDPEQEVLTIEGVSAQFGTTVVENNAIVLTLGAGFIGQVNLEYSVRDTQDTRDSAQVSVTIVGDRDGQAPQITVPDDIVTNATGLLTFVDLGTAIAIDPSSGEQLPVMLVDSNSFFSPGRHTVAWSATNSLGQESVASQVVDVLPLISTSMNDVVAEGVSTTIDILLNGEAPAYPVVIDYVISGTAVAGDDHSGESGQVVIEQGTSAAITIDIFNDDVVEGDETLILSLDGALNLGVNNQTQVTISEANIAPEASLVVTQSGEQRLVVGQDGGNVIVSANIIDVNNDNLSVEWFAGDSIVDLSASDETFEFAPSAIAPGVITVGLTVTDSGIPVLSDTTSVIIDLRANLPLLSEEDTDGDLIPDDREGLGDADGDGIPDFQDAIDEVNVIPEQIDNQVEFLVEGDPGVSLRRGVISTASNTGGVQLTLEEGNALLGEDPEAENIGGLFDFVANNLPEAGQNYRVVLPQRLPVPTDARYRKFRQGQWRDFVIDENNRLSSASGVRGICPPPGDGAYSDGLNEGDWCVQLQIQDGGPNDDDDVANGAIVDPGGIAVTLSGNNLPQAQDDTISLLFNTQVIIDVLANDTDEDGDVLSILSADAQFGQVTINDDNTLTYEPNQDFVGEDIIGYAVTDGNGGTGNALVVVTVIPNNPPVAADDNTQTDHLTPIEIDVLSNDLDDDGDTLSLVDAIVDVGQVTILADSQTLLYTPQERFDGLVTIVYTITDGSSQALGMAFVQVQGNRAPIANSDSSSTDDRTAVTINVLENDTDEDNDILTVTQASATSGTVEINTNNSLTYTPQAGFNGTDTISYTIDDGFGGTSQGSVTVQVQAFETIQVTNESGGGSLSGIWITLLVLVGAVRRFNRFQLFAILMLFLGSLSAKANDWYVEASIGSSSTDTNLSGLPGGITVLDIDDTDSSFSIGVGYELSQRFSALVRYVDLGDGEVSLQGDSLTPQDFQDNLARFSPILADGLTIGGSVVVWQNATISAKIEAGVFFWDGEIDSAAGARQVSFSDDGTDLYWGGDIGYALNDDWSVHVGYRLYQLEESISDFNVGLRWRF